MGWQIILCRQYRMAKSLTNCSQSCSKHSLTFEDELRDEFLQVIIPAPYWTSYPSMAELAGGKAVIVQTQLESGFLMSAKQLRGALSPASRILILCSPSNPTGAVYGAELLQVSFFQNDSNICSRNRSLKNRILPQQCRQSIFWALCCLQPLLCAEAYE